MKHQQACGADGVLSRSETDPDPSRCRRKTMRTTARLLTSTALAAAVTGLGAGASGAYAGDADPLEVFPSTAEPGSTITVNTTACGRNGQAVGDARSLGAGEFRPGPGT